MSKENRRYQEGVIRSLFARPEQLVSVIDILDSNDFEDVNYKLIYESMVEVFLLGKAITLPEIALRIGETGGSIDTGWFFNLEQNISAWIQVAPPVTWAKLLKRESARLKARNVLTEGLVEVNDSKSNPLEVMDKISTNLTKVSLETSAEEKFDIKDAIEEFKQESEQIQKSGGKIAAISSSYPSIDFYTQGWAPTHLITVGARTGIGKSVFAINNAVTAMIQEKSVLFFSLEMTRREVISRMVASIAQIPIQKIEKAIPLSEDEKERHDEALEMIANSKLIIDTNPYVTIEYLKRTSIKQAQSDDGLDFIIIDYLQLIQNEGKRNRQEAVAEVSRSVKILAKELNVPVMVLVQLNREKKDADSNEKDNIPKLYDIRESGAIAQDSNVVILIHRDLEQDAELVDPKALFILAKNRQGEANKYISVRTRLDCSLFMDDGKKGEDVINELEESINQNGEYEEVNFDAISKPASSVVLTESEKLIEAHFSDNGNSPLEEAPVFDFDANEAPALESDFSFEDTTHNSQGVTDEEFLLNVESEVGNAEDVFGGYNPNEDIFADPDFTTYED